MPHTLNTAFLSGDCSSCWDGTRRILSTSLVGNSSSKRLASSTDRLASSFTDVDEHDPDEDAESGDQEGSGVVDYVKKGATTTQYGRTARTNEKCKCSAGVLDLNGGKSTEAAQTSQELQERLRSAAELSSGTKMEKRRIAWESKRRLFERQLHEFESAYLEFDRARGIRDDAYAGVKQVWLEQCRALQLDKEVELDCGRLYREATHQLYTRKLPPTCPFGAVSVVPPFASDIERARMKFGSLLGMFF
ncbi:unnamed protein product [Amoebophrya sp. A25]|nr:unnamed protein product [Amoebophrya sp. A25]|eukprot:GSA25T00023143001.1